MLLWLCLTVAVVATIGSAIYLTLRGLESFRSFKALARATSDGLRRIEESSARIEEHLARADASSGRLERELAQLRRSRARLNVLTSALDDVRASFGRITAVYPRK